MNSEFDLSNNCTICLKEDINENDIYTTDCNHIFCNECLDDWFKRGNQSCPLCRSQIDEYTYKGDTYKLIIHTVERNNQINRNDLILNDETIRNIVRKNIRLRFYSFSLTFLFLYIFNNYLYSLNNLNMISNELNTCNLNTTQLNNELEQCKNPLYNNILSGYYISMYNGVISRNCFYPQKLYDICFG
jgi:hypothetical protein